MDAGLMRHRITVQKMPETDNEYGEAAEGWTDVVSIRASIQPLSAREFIAGMRENAEVTHKITIRYNPAIKASMRVIFGTREFDIMHIVDTWEHHHEMVLMCKELI